MTNIAALPCTIFATRLSPRAVYFIQTGGSALSNTYSIVVNFVGIKFSWISLSFFIHNLRSFICMVIKVYYLERLVSRYKNINLFFYSSSLRHSTHSTEIHLSVFSL